MYTNILIATDGSEVANRAVAHGVGLAKEQKARVTLVTVTERWSALTLGVESEHGNRDPLSQYEAVAAEAAKRILDQAEKVAASQGVPCERVHVPDQSPADGILAVAKSKNCDLIVMGSHGRRGIDHVLVGSRAYEVLAHSKVPVLIVR